MNIFSGAAFELLIEVLFNKGFYAVDPISSQVVLFNIQRVSDFFYTRDLLR